MAGRRPGWATPPSTTPRVVAFVAARAQHSSYAAWPSQRNVLSRIQLSADGTQLVLVWLLHVGMRPSQPSAGPPPSNDQFDFLRANRTMCRLSEERDDIGDTSSLGSSAANAAE